MNFTRYLKAQVVRNMTTVGLLMAFGGLGVSQAKAALAADHDHFTYTESSGTFLPQEGSFDFDGGAIDSANSQSGQTTITSVDGVQVGVKQTATHAANPAAGETKIYTKTQIVSVEGGPVSPGTRFENFAGADISDSFTITADNQAALRPGAMATLTFKLDGAFNPSQGLDLTSGPADMPNNYAELLAVAAIFETGTFDLIVQNELLDRDDFETEEEFIQASDDLDQQIEARYNVFAPTWLISNQAVVDLANQEFIDELRDPLARLLSPGPVMALMTVEVPLDQLDISFEWTAQFLTTTYLDASAGVDASIEMDFANTGVVTLTIPEGFSVTSGSGLFPQSNIIVLAAPDDTSPVPEPMTAVLGVMSFAGLMVAARRRRAA